MSLQVKVNTIDRTSLIEQEGFSVEQVLTSQADTTKLKYRKYGSRSFVPAINDAVDVYDGSTHIFSGTIIRIDEETIANPAGLEYSVECVDLSYSLDNMLVAKTYSAMTIKDIILDIIANYAPTFTTVNVQSNFTVGAVVFNQIPVSECLKRLADIVRYEWFVDADKDLHFFPKYTTLAPINLTDVSGNYVVDTLKRRIDGTQIANVVKIRGGLYDAASFTDVITVKGSGQQAFKLPYQFANLVVELDTGAGYASQTLGIDFIDDFTTKDVLYNYNERTIKWGSALADGNKIRFTGNPKVRVLAVATDDPSIALYGRKEKLIKDESIAEIDTARRRAAAELEAYKEKASEVTFKTYTPGLTVGQVINLNSSQRTVNDNFLISRVKFGPYKPDAFAYTVSLTSQRKYDLIDVLQSLIKPDDQQASDAEVAEDIRTDSAIITVEELISLPAAVTDFITVTVTESLSKDPLGAGVEPTWVLGPYFPSSVSDTKRELNCDYSFELY